MRLIDADEFTKYCKDGLEEYKRDPKYKYVFAPLEIVTRGFINDIEEQPTVDAEPVMHGMWKEAVGTKDGCFFKTHTYCSRCGYVKPGELKTYTIKYCPNCGARMEGDANG